MAFPQGPRRGPTPTRPRGPVFAVGQRVPVRSAGGHPTRVALTDEAERQTVGSVIDGTEVEILAWRPGGSRGVRYRVRATPDGLDGWLAAASLCPPGSPAMAPVPGSGPAAPASLHAKDAVDTGRRFGQR